MALSSWKENHSTFHHDSVWTAAVAVKPRSHDVTSLCGAFLTQPSLGPVASLAPCHSCTPRVLAGPRCEMEVLKTHRLRCAYLAQSSRNLDQEREDAAKQERQNTLQESIEARCVPCVVWAGYRFRDVGRDRTSLWDVGGQNVEGVTFLTKLVSGGGL